MVFHTEIRCRTQGHRDFIDLTLEIQRLVAESGVSTGVAHLFVTGSRAAIGTIEYAPGAHPELADMLDRVIPPPDAPGVRPGFGFAPEPPRREEAAPWHLQATLLGASPTIPARPARGDRRPSVHPPPGMRLRAPRPRDHPDDPRRVRGDEGWQMTD